MVALLRLGIIILSFIAETSVFAQTSPPSAVPPPMPRPSPAAEAGWVAVEPTPFATPPQQAKAQPRPAQRDIDECLKAYENTNKCCQRPLSCIGMGSRADDISLAIQFFGMVSAGAMGNQDPGQMSKACKIMQTIGTIGAVVNGGAATLCFAMKSKCESTCSKVQKYYEGRKDTSNAFLAESRIESCRTFMREVTAYTQQAIVAYGAADMGKLCGEMVQEDTTDVVAIPNIDCTNPANQADPRCRDCSNPVNANNPMCQKPVVPEGPGVATSEGLGESGDSLFNSYEKNDGNPTKQSPQFPDIGSNQKSSSPGVPGGGGGFVGSGGAVGAGLDGEKEAGAGGGGYNTDVLRGLSGGGGYSGNPGGGATVSPSGGFAGYGQGNKAAPGKFDLKQFLPGGEKDPGRKLAGTGLASPEIGPRDIDIWERVTKRVKEICKLNRLYDCNKL